VSEAATWRAWALSRLPGGDEERSEVLAALLARTPEEWRERVDDELAKALVALLGDASRTRQRRAADAIGALFTDVPALERELSRSLASPEARLRWGAAYTLGRAASPRADIWPPVREALAREDGDQRWAAAELACRLAREHASVLQEIRDGLSSPSPTLRRMLLYCLRDLAVPDLARAACGALADPDSGVRLAALSALTRAPLAGESTICAEAVAALLEAEPEPGVRRAAAAALGKLGVASAPVLEALSRAAASDDASLARVAAAARTQLA